MSSILASACTIRPSLAGPTCRGRLAQTPAFQSSVPRRTLLVRAEDPKKGETNDKAKDPVNKGGKAYIDELPVNRCGPFVLYVSSIHERFVNVLSMLC